MQGADETQTFEVTIDPIYTLLSQAGAWLGVAALLLTVIFLIVGFCFWKRPTRGAWFRRAAKGTLVAAASIGLSVGVTYFLMLPDIGRQMRAHQDAIREDFVEETSLVVVGAVAPDFSVTTIDGDACTLSEYRGRYVVVNFFATWCGPCLAELPQLQKLSYEFGNSDRTAMIVIGREDTEEAVLKFREEQGLTLPMAADADRSVYSLYATEGVPRTYLIDPEGRVALMAVGFDEEKIDEIGEMVRSR